MISLQTKWEKPISEWIDEEKKEYETFQKLHDIWLSSRVYRRMSFDNFIKEVVSILINKHGH